MCFCARKILAPGEEENLELEGEEDAAAGHGSTDAFSPRAPGKCKRGCNQLCRPLSDV